MKQLRDGNRNNGYYWACCRAAEMLEEGAISELSAAYLIETAVSIGLPRPEAESTYRSAMGRLDLGPITTTSTTRPPAAAVGDDAGGWRKLLRTIADSGLTHPEIGLYAWLLAKADWRTSTITITTADLADVAGSARPPSDAACSGCDAAAGSTTRSPRAREIRSRSAWPTPPTPPYALSTI